ncbi:MAG: efflux RND transporter periplasmic adaptor subunit [Rhodocyclaceae bacterium]|jgi:RND family efflux transporter MFP subunit|nr:efflux RND transporter periplasmic adaptor subunit [Rhodocyclaceae bacterium]MBK9309820.1 efflux RND transporter periplasmic adaptor subunit [Rhodocyclaceae bacterium]MBK9953617.1 efflux RND transporter periplasmic adaptor subunit [Rhodocyclaceae bacterium]
MPSCRSWLLLLVAANAATVFATEESIALSTEQAKRGGIVTAALADMKATGGIRLAAQVVVPPSQIEVIAAPLPVLVASVRVAHGETVKKGQMLARVQGAPLLELQREFAQARSQASLAAESLRRDESLYADGIIPQARLSATRAAERQTALALAEKSQSLHLAGLAEPNVGGSLASGADIRAPFDGVVLEASAQPGQRVDAMTPLFKLGRISTLWAEIQATPAQAAGISVGDEVGVPGCPSGARISVIAPQVDAHDQSMRLRAELPYRVPCVRPNQFVQVDVRPAETSSSYAWRVPAGALTRHLSRTWVFVEVPGGFRPVAVQVLEESAQSSRVAVPVDASERIAIKGIAMLKGVWLGLGAVEP